MDFNDKRFGGNPHSDKDRTVPPDENYYSGNGFDFSSFSRENRNADYGLNPADEYSPNRRSINRDDNYKADITEDFYKNFGRSASDRFDEKYNSGENRHSERYGRQNTSDDIYGSFERRRILDNFDRAPEERNRNRHLNKPEKKKKTHKKLKIVVSVLSVLLALVLIITATGFSALAKINHNEKTENRYVNSTELKSSPDVKNILLLGVDARANESGDASRSDTMILVSIDSANSCIKMTSFLRDSWVYIPCRDTRQRLNAACSYGGYSAVADTIEYNFGVKIDGYVVADFEMFKVMVDCLGGVKIDVTEEEANEVTNHRGRYGNVVLEAGKNNLTGEQALAYCRIRKIDTDWKRTERQRIVMEAIIKKAARSPVSTLKMLNKIAPYIDTDLSTAEIINAALKAAGNISGGFQQEACPFDGTWEYANKGGASVISLNKEKNKQKLAEFIYGTDSKASS